MAHYFVNNAADANGAHEVHLVGCVRMAVDKRYLGNFHSVSEALMEARKDFWQSRGCERCAREPEGIDVVRTHQLALPLGPRFIG